MNVNSPTTLPGGMLLPNRIVKAAMTENLGDGMNRATKAHVTLYRRWAATGAAIMITGNVLVDRRFLEAPANVAIEPGISEEERTRLTEWAKAATPAGGAVFMQISHAGRQTPKIVSDRPVAPSPVALDMPGRLLYPFANPRAMTGEEVTHAISRFGHAAKVARETGFHGVQVHAAHGYLISQFLSPRANQRSDEWGGHFENRVRFLVEVIRSVRREAGADYPVAVKLNSADFQKGGFSHEDCLAVIDRLNDLNICFVEISGGTYEQPQMVGVNGKNAPQDAERLSASTIAREAYFVEYAKSVRARAKMPIMATGGFRQLVSMNAALESGHCDLIGLARPFCAAPEQIADLLRGELRKLEAPEKTLSLGPGVLSPKSRNTLMRTINGWGMQGWFYEQIRRMGRGEDPDLNLSVLGGLMKMQSAVKKEARARNRARSGQSGITS